MLGSGGQISGSIIITHILLPPSNVRDSIVKDIFGRCKDSDLKESMAWDIKKRPYNVISDYYRIEVITQSIILSSKLPPQQPHLCGH